MRRVAWFFAVLWGFMTFTEVFLVGMKLVDTHYAMTLGMWALAEAIGAKEATRSTPPRTP